MTRPVSLLLIAATLILCGLSAWTLKHNPRHIADPQAGPGANATHLATQIDPNTADWQSLAVLPQLGERRARDIVHYRDAHNTRHPDQPAFTTPQDLLLVKGIGPSMLDTLKPHLTFPTTAPAE